VATSHPCFLQHHVRCLSFERQAVCESTKSNFVCLFGGRVALYVEQNQPCGPFKSPSSRFQFGVMWWTGEPKPNRICWQSSSFFRSLYMSPPPLRLFLFCCISSSIPPSSLLSPTFTCALFRAKVALLFRYSLCYTSVIISQWQPSCFSDVVADTCTLRNVCRIYTVSNVWWYLKEVNFMIVGFCIMTPVIWCVDSPAANLHRSVVQKPQSCGSIDLS